MENKFCQSCGMPMTAEEQFGRNADVSPRMENIVLIAIVTGLLLKIVRWTR